MSIGYSALANEPVFQKQKYKHSPSEGTFGDCHRTAIACLLGMSRDDVPHWGVHYDDYEKFKSMKNEFLSSKGLREYTFPFYSNGTDEALQWMAKVNPSIFYMLTGKSRNGTAHVVICKDSSIVWDTAIDDSGIVEGLDTGEDGYGWFYFDVLIPDFHLPLRISSGHSDTPPQ